MTPSLKDRRVLVIGRSNGIARAVSLAVRAEWATVGSAPRLVDH